MCNNKNLTAERDRHISGAERNAFNLNDEEYSISCSNKSRHHLLPLAGQMSAHRKRRLGKNAESVRLANALRYADSFHFQLFAANGRVSHSTATDLRGIRIVISDTFSQYSVWRSISMEFLQLHCAPSPVALMP